MIGTWSRFFTPERRRLFLLLLTGIGVIPWLAYLTFYGSALDAHAYFVARPGQLYTLNWGTTDAFVYSPAFSQAIEPLRMLGFEGFLTAWRLMELAAMTVMSGPFIGPLLFVYPISLEFNVGNIHALLGLAIVAGFRWPALWSFVLLTKVTPGIGLLWFAVRREWRNLGIAVGATIAIVVVSVVISPSDWAAWLGYLTTPQPPLDNHQFITAPLWMRLPAAVVLVIWGARTERRWTVLVAAFLALPSIWETSLAMLLGLIFLSWELTRRWLKRNADRSIS